MTDATIRDLFAIGLLCAAGVLGYAQTDPSIRLEDKVHRIQTETYQATVAADGCLTSLRIGATEFIEAKVCRGAYFYQDKSLSLPQVRQTDKTTVAAESDKASVRYEFGPQTLTWTLTNATDKPMLFLIVFDPAVNVVVGEDGRYHKAPLTRPGQATTWFCGPSRLRITPATRLWGPWAGNHQVWQLDLAARETRQVVLEAGPATAAETAQVAATAAYVPVPPTDPTGPMWDLAALSRPPAVRPAEGFAAEGLQAVFYDGLPFEGKPTRVFAWIGIPRVEPGQRVPGIVLVHGGGGTAFASWVQLWVQRGYAAISMDTCGCLPGGDHGKRPHDPLGGPWGWGGFDQIDWPREDQWTYHAIADAILAHSLLRSLPQVDPERTGVTGISWGGYLTSILAGVDPRFKFAVPVYGCGYYLDTVFGDQVRALGKERAERWVRWWDPSNYLPQAAMPILWVTGSNDFAYTLPALQQSYRAARGPQTLCVRLRMPHGHGPAGEGPAEICTFADSFTRGGAPLARITGQGREGDSVWAGFDARVPVVRAELNYTCDRGKWQDRKWDAVPARLEAAGRVTATLPAGTVVYYLNLVDERNLVVSGEHVEVAP